MDSIIQQLGINETFFYQLGIFTVFFALIRISFFKPFYRLIELRSQKTGTDLSRAEQTLAEVKAQLEKYESTIGAERLAAKQELDRALGEVKQEGSKIIGEARASARASIQAASEAAAKESTDLRRQLEVDVESLSVRVTEMLLSRGGA